MSYEIITGFKIDKKNNCIKISGAANNIRPLDYWHDEWKPNENQTLDDVLRECLDSFIDGGLQPRSSLYGIKYAILKAKQKAEELLNTKDVSSAIWKQRQYTEDNKRIYTDIDNKIFNAFKEALEEKDSNKKYYVMYGCYPSKHHGRSGIKYCYDISDRFLMSYKQAYELANCWVGQTYNLKMVEA